MSKLLRIMILNTENSSLILEIDFFNILTKIILGLSYVLFMPRFISPLIKVDEQTQIVDIKSTANCDRSTFINLIDDKSVDLYFLCKF